MERKFFRCASLRSGSGVEVFSPKGEAFCASLTASPVVDASVESLWRKEECGGMTGL